MSCQLTYLENQDELPAHLSRKSKWVASLIIYLIYLINNVIDIVVLKLEERLFLFKMRKSLLYRKPKIENTEFLKKSTWTHSFLIRKAFQSTIVNPDMPLYEWRVTRNYDYSLFYYNLPENQYNSLFNYNLPEHQYNSLFNYSL